MNLDEYIYIGEVNFFKNIEDNKVRVYLSYFLDEMSDIIIIVYTMTVHHEFSDQVSIF